MRYLFDSMVEPAIKGASTDHNAKNLKLVCEKETQHLISECPRTLNIHDDFQWAECWVKLMGTKNTAAQKELQLPFNLVMNRGLPHASQSRFVESTAWNRVSNNYLVMQDLVRSELNHAYQLGLNIRNY